MMRWPKTALHRKLHHRNVRVRISHDQRHPCAVIQSALPIGSDREPGQFEKLSNPLRQSGGSRSRILHRIKLCRKAPEIVNGCVRFDGIHRGFGRFPMRGYGQDRLRFPEGRGKLAEEAARGIIGQDKIGCAMRQK